MASLNKVFIIGNLTKKPELRSTKEGSSVSDLRIAVSRNFLNKDRERQEEVCYVDVVVWARQAETCVEYLDKGSPVLVEGSLQQDTWETSNGEKRSKIRIRAQRVQFLSRGSKAESSQGSGDIPADAQDEGAEQSEDDIPF
ncbi:MAG: single-stranded DNA-binding protein [Candidatus Aureabacteria bacterium]|nr:single-stranded DNA-binding protein [Candidatus Auribacterota bacterium]